MKRFLFMFIKEEKYKQRINKVSIPPPDYIGVILVENDSEVDERIKKHMPKGYKLGIVEITESKGFMIELEKWKTIDI